MKPRSFNQILNDITRVFVGDGSSNANSTVGNPLGPQTTLTGAAAAPAGVGNGIASGGTTITYTPAYSGNLTVSLGGSSFPMFHSMTSEEKQELDDLKKEYNLKLKAARLTEFKKIPKELRQHVIDALQWDEFVETSNNMSVDKDQRLVELETKNNHHMLYSGQINIINNNMWSPYISTNSVRMPSDITINDLRNAHVEASLEEEMLGNGSNS